MSDQDDQTLEDDKDQTDPKPAEFDFARFPRNTLFHDRRGGRDRRGKRADPAEDDHRSAPSAAIERRTKKERRRRIDPTTFEKQYTENELEFMNAMQRFKELSGKAFPTHGDVLKVAVGLGYRRVVVEPENGWEGPEPEVPSLIQPTSIEA
jgi:hypothetical protein